MNEKFEPRIVKLYNYLQELFWPVLSAETGRNFHDWAELIFDWFLTISVIFGIFYTYVWTSKIVRAIWRRFFREQF